MAEKPAGVGRGVVLYNVGDKMAVRMACCLNSLRRVYDGPVAIMSEGLESHRFVAVLCRAYSARFLPVEFKTPDGHATCYLNATLTHLHTPYATTIWLDSDTLCLRPFAESWFQAAEKETFAIARFSDWTPSRADGTPTNIGKRVLSFREIYPEWMAPALDYPAAINCGLFAFTEASELMRDWWTMAIKVRDLHMIPDEVTCQMMLPKYRHALLDHWHNCSCKYDKPKDPQALVCHYHGRKHCRLDDDDRYIFNSDLWYAELDRVMELEYWPIIRPYVLRDKQLKTFGDRRQRKVGRNRLCES